MTTPRDPFWRPDPENDAHWQRQHWLPQQGQVGPPGAGAPQGYPPEFAQHPEYAQQPPYGQQQYGQPLDYGQPVEYGQQPQYGRPAEYGQAVEYGQQQYGQPVEYGQPLEYGRQAGYAQGPEYAQPLEYGDEQEYEYGPYGRHSAPGVQFEPPSYEGPAQYGGQTYPEHAGEYAPPLYGGVQLYGQSTPDAVDPQDYSDEPPRRRRAPVFAVSVIALVLLAVAGVVVWKVTDKPSNTSTASGTSSAHAPSALSGSTGASVPSSARSVNGPVDAIPRRPDVNPPHDGSPGIVAGPTFGPADRVYHMDLSGIPFKFDVPLNWSCMPSTKMASEFLAAWTCYDSNVQGGAGGLVAVQNCPSPCGPADQDKLRTLLPVQANSWRPIDAATDYGEESGTLTNGANKGEQVSRVAMTYVFAANAGGPLDTMAFAQFTGPPADKVDMQKVINDIRVRAAG